MDDKLPCVWHLIYQRAEKLGRLDRLLEVQSPLDWSRVGHETWMTAITSAKKWGILSPFQLAKNPSRYSQVEDFFYNLRQPDWWQGDDRYHPPTPSKPASNLQAALESGEFVITAEITPPTGVSRTKIQAKAAPLKGVICAANVTQNPMAAPRMSALACAQFLVSQGIEPVLQLTARDYNRITLQSEALGASTLGIHNILCLTGDPPSMSPGPSGGLPFDLDATQMLWILRRLRDEARFLDGRQTREPPRLFIGAAASPSGNNLAHEALRLEKKINAGAQYIQTQIVYDLETVERWIAALDKRLLLPKVHILVGIGPLRSTKMARHLQDRIPDIVIPGHIIERLAQSSSPEETGFEIAVELIHKAKSLPGVKGVHIMSLGQENFLIRLLGEIRSKDI